MKFNDLCKNLFLENINDTLNSIIKRRMDYLEKLIIKKQRGFQLDRDIAKEAKEIADLLIRHKIDFDVFFSAYSDYSDFSKSEVKTSFNKLKEKSKLQSTSLQIDSYWNMFEPLFNTLENTLKENITDRMRDIQNEIGSESLKSFMYKTSKYKEYVGELKKSIEDLKNKGETYSREFSSLNDTLYRTEKQIYTQHPLYWLTRYISKGGIVEPEYSEIIEKVIKDSIAENKVKLKASLSKTLKDENVTDVKEKSIRIGDLGFEGDFELTFDNGSKRTLRTQAVGAGGYNIQSFHYRYLCKLLK